MQCAWSAGRKKACYTQAAIPPTARARRSQEGRLRRGCFDPHRYLSHIQRGDQYQDLGPDHFDRRSKQQQTKRLLKRLADLGFAAALTLIPTVSW